MNKSSEWAVGKTQSPTYNMKLNLKFLNLAKCGFMQGRATLFLGNKYDKI